MKNQPTRTCMGCNEKKAKNDLIRIVKNKNDEINIDRTGNWMVEELTYMTTSNA